MVDVHVSGGRGVGVRVGGGGVRVGVGVHVGGGDSSGWWALVVRWWAVIVVCGQGIIGVGGGCCAWSCQHRPSASWDGVCGVVEKSSTWHTRMGMPRQPFGGGCRGQCLHRWLR